jgi:hypothetical protein
MKHLAGSMEKLTADEIHRLATTPLPSISIIKPIYNLGTKRMHNPDARQILVSESEAYSELKFK